MQVEPVLASRDLTSRSVMRPILCTLFQERKQTNSLGSLGGVIFEDHIEFARSFEEPNGHRFQDTKRDIDAGIVGPHFWTTSASESNFSHIFAIGDVHSDLLSLLSALFLAKVININGEWIAKNTIVIQLGDVLDRKRPGMKGVKHTSFNEREEIDIIQYMFGLDYQARERNSRIISITGNHDIWPYEGPSIKDRQGYVGYNLRGYGSMKQRDDFFRSEGMRNYMAFYRPPIFRVNNWLAMHGGIHPTKLREHMLVLKEQNEDEDPMPWISEQWLQGMLEPSKAFPPFIMDAMYDRYWALNPHDRKVEQCSDNMMAMLRYFNIPGDGGVFLGHTPMWISKNGRRDASNFNGIEVVGNLRCTSAACGVVLADVAASEGFHVLLNEREMKNAKTVAKYYDEDTKSTSIVHVDRRQKHLQRIRTDVLNRNTRQNAVRVVERFNGKKWIRVRNDRLSRKLMDHILSMDGRCE